MDHELLTGPPHKMGARPKEPGEEKQDYDDYLVGAAAAEPSAATAFTVSYTHLTLPTNREV